MNSEPAIWFYLESKSDDFVLNFVAKSKSDLFFLLSISPSYTEEAEEYLRKVNQVRHDTAAAIYFALQRELPVSDDGVLDSAKTKLVNIAKQFKIHPSKFEESFESLGVSEVWVFLGEVSVLDMEFQEKKDKLKREGIAFIKAHPDCSETDLIDFADATYNEEDAALSKYLMKRYQNWAYTRGFVTDNTFENFRDFIVSTPEELLEAL